MDILLNIILFMIVYFLGFLAGNKNGYIAGRIIAAEQLKAAHDEINQTLRLAEIKGIDTSKLTAEQIMELVLQRRKDIEKAND